MHRDATIKAVRRTLAANGFRGPAYIFGSAMSLVSQRSDVDIILILRERAVRERLRNAKKQFRIIYQQRLHVQLFYSFQVGKIIQFLRNCGPYSRLM
jgi:hypothetical protein